MRRNVLVRSVERLLPGVVTSDVALMWRRSPWLLPAVVAATAATFALLTAFGVATPSGRFVIALAVGLVASVLATEYRIVARDDDAVVQLRCGRLRHVAVDVIGPLPEGAALEVVSSNMVFSDWLIDDTRFSVPRGSQQAMTALADWHHR